MNAEKTVCIGLIGAGFAAYLHGNGYERVSGVPVRLKTVVDVNARKAEAVKKRYSFEKSGNDYREILGDPEIDVVDIVTPPFLHVSMIREALGAGKHVICEKPLTGYHGEPSDERPIGKRVSKKKMCETVIKDLDELGRLVESAEKSGKKFFYAENYVYAPPIVKAAEVVTKKKSKILFMKGEESVKGSTSPVAGEWEKTGGGSLIRLGTHPLSGMLYLKQAEARARGEDISVRSVTADAGFVTECLTEREHRHITARPQDVEDFSNVTVTFSDGTKAVVIATDLVLGGTKNYVEVYANDSALLCNLTPTDMLNAYFLDEDGLEDVAISEMLPQKLGWNKAFVSDEIVRGYIGEFQDFMESVALDRSAASGFSLARDTARVIYAAYRSAEEGVKINL